MLALLSLVVVAGALFLLARPGTPPVLVESDFASAGDRTLPVTQEGPVRLGPEAGVYRMTLLAPGHPAVYAGLAEAVLGVDIEAVVAVVAAPDASTQGLACMAEGGDGYAFVGTPSGRFAVDRYVDGVRSARLAVDDVPVTSPGAATVLRLRCTNRPASATTTLTAWVDGHRVASVEHRSGALAFRYVGFVADSPGPASYVIDDLVVRGG